MGYAPIIQKDKPQRKKSQKDEKETRMALIRLSQPIGIQTWEKKFMICVLRWLPHIAFIFASRKLALLGPLSRFIITMGARLNLRALYS
jgi:hypothetical protein